jgi:hypothetical protein
MGWGVTFLDGTKHPLTIQALKPASAYKKKRNITAKALKIF